MTTGSTVQGTVDGLAGGFGAPTSPFIGKVVSVLGNPTTSKVPGITSGLAHDATNGKVYMNISGTTWQNMTSGT